MIKSKQILGRITIINGFISLSEGKGYQNELVQSNWYPMMFEKLILKPSEIEVFVRGEKVKDEQRYTHPMERKIKSR